MIGVLDIFSAFLITLYIHVIKEKWSKELEEAPRLQGWWLYGVMKWYEYSTYVVYGMVRLHEHGTFAVFVSGSSLSAICIILVLAWVEVVYMVEA